MGDSKLDTLKGKLAALQEKIEAETKVEAAQTAIDKVRDTFTDAILATIAKVEKDSGASLKAIGIGIWAGCEGFQDGRSRTGCARCGLSFTKGGDERWQATTTARPTTTARS